jgi:hypothetical protein
VSRGYWDYSYMASCPCCSSGPKSKFLCTECLHVCKAPNRGAPLCPACRTPMRNMGQRWRPAKKGKLEVPPPRQGLPSPGEQLLARLTGT